MRRDLAHSGVQTFDTIPDGLVHLDLVLFGEPEQRRGGEHFGSRAETKEHFGLHLRVGLDIRHAECLLIDHLISADDRDHRPRRVLLLELAPGLAVELIKAARHRKIKQQNLQAVRFMNQLSPDDFGDALITLHL
jgi:hypothetical protein